ncbi:hypothetical protein D3C78_832350 [compost metagenome]
MLQELGVNITKLNPIASYFDLMVAASEKFDLPVRHPSGQIPGSVHNVVKGRSFAVWITNKPLLRLPFIRIA